MSSRRYSAVAAAGVTALLLGVQGVDARPRRPAPKAPVAGGTTVIRGSDTGFSLVRIPRKASIATPFGESRDVSAKGEGDFVGFALLAADPSGRVVTSEDGSPSGVLGGRLPGSERIDFVMPIGGAQYDFTKYYEDKVTFPAGLYRLYLIAGTGPATVEVELEGLGGRTTIGVRSPARHQVVRPPSTVLPGATRNVYSAGAHRSIDSPGLMFQGLWLKTNPHATGQYGFCYYADTPPPEPAAYAPGCPAADYSFVNDRHLMVEEDTKLYLETIPLSREGIFGQGFWYSTQSLVSDMANVALWLEFDGK